MFYYFSTLILLVLGLCLVYYPVAMIYAVILLLFVLTITTILCLLNGLTSFLPFILISVYLGAMMVMIGYICAVIPNMKLTNKSLLSFNYFYWLLIVFMAVGMGSPALLSSSPTSAVNYLSYFFYGYLGSSFFIIMVLFLLILMLIPNLCLPYTAPLRSVFLSYSVNAWEILILSEWSSSPLS